MGGVGVNSLCQQDGLFAFIVNRHSVICRSGQAGTYQESHPLLAYSRRIDMHLICRLSCISFKNVVQFFCHNGNSAAMLSVSLNASVDGDSGTCAAKGHARMPTH